MRKIEENMISALDTETNVSLNNTSVTDGEVSLFGNLIAVLTEESLYITSAGHPTSTTLSRLNALLSFYVPYIRINRVKGNLIITNKLENSKTEWNGEFISFEL